jgi:BlaI family penicillinase repressor
VAENEVPSGSPDPPGVSNAELRVLQSLWEYGASTIRQLTKRLYPAVTTANYSTVQKLLERLEEDRCVSRDRSVTPHVFVAAVSRDDYIGGQLRAMAEKLCGGSLTPLLTHLVKTESLSQKERGELRKFLEESKPRPK